MAEVLSLSTTRQRRTVVIDGKPYEMLDRDEIPLIDALTLEDFGKQFDKASKGELTEDQIAALGKRLSAAVLRFLPGVGEVEAKLSDVQRLRLLNVFCQASPASVATAEENPTRAA
jgi:hypothetical protein